MASNVIELSLVDGTGAIRTFGPHDSPDKLPAVKVGLGALGIITEVTLRVVPLYRTFAHEFLIPDSEFLSKLPEFLLFSGHSTKAWRVPHTRNTLIMSQVDVQPDGSGLQDVPSGEPLPQVRVTAAAADLTTDYRTVPGVVTEFFAYVSELVAFCTAWYPPVRQYTSSVVSQLMFGLPKTRIARSDLVQIVPFRVPRHTEMEYAVPGVECADTLAELSAWMEAEGVYSDFVHEVRMSRRDGDWISMGYHPEHDAALMAAVNGADIHTRVDPFELYASHLSPKERALCSPQAMQEQGITSKAALHRRTLLCNSVCHTTIGLGFASETDIHKYFDGFERIALQHGGRPHWAKRFSANADQLTRAYPRMAAWRELRSQMDPRGVFINDFVARVVD
jgi:FAD/FMN-containing dehydrogenase